MAVSKRIGLRFDHGAGEIRFEHPMLPGFLEHLHVLQLRLGDAVADVMLHRFDGEMAATVTRREGRFRIVVLHQPSYVY